MIGGLPARLRARLAPDIAALSETRGGATLDFVLVFAPFVGLMTYAAQIALSQYFLMAATDAAERVARLAATQPIAHCAALRNAAGDRVYDLDATVHAVEPARRSERSCLNEPSPCAPMPGRWTCRIDPDGTLSPNCSRQGMERLLERAALPGVRLSQIEVAYTDSGFGHVGEPVVPMIEVFIPQRDLPLTSLFLHAPEAQPTVGTRVIGAGAGDLKWEASSC